MSKRIVFATKIKVASLLAVVLSFCFLSNVMAFGMSEGFCRLDWNQDGTVTYEDLYDGENLGGYYLEWFVQRYYPERYVEIFPNSAPFMVDLNFDGAIDNLDMYGSFSETEDTEGFYYEYLLFFDYPEYYYTYMPNSGCCAGPDTDGDGVCDHQDLCEGDDTIGDLDSDGECGPVGCFEEYCESCCGDECCGAGEVCDAANTCCDSGLCQEGGPVWQDVGCGGLLNCGPWVRVEGGNFVMGKNSSTASKPEHTVSVPSFEMWRTEVTITQYWACMNDGLCDTPAFHQQYSQCNWNGFVAMAHPINCVDWHQAKQFCIWAGGRLPTEAEWEFAARNGSQGTTYPWGSDTPSCELAHYALGYDNCCGGTCETNRVCSRSPEGDNDLGMCDLAGNVWEWVEDDYHAFYDTGGYGYDLNNDGVVDAPLDGSAWFAVPRDNDRIVRGGGFEFTVSDLDARTRWLHFGAEEFDPRVGIRCVRDLDPPSGGLYCSEGCHPDMIGDGTCDLACDNDACDFDNFDCVCAAGCSNTSLGDGHCDSACDNVACGYDNADCLCAPGCMDSMLGDGTCNSACDHLSCGFDNDDCLCAPGCFDDYINNGQCNGACHVSECGYDGSDCHCSPGCYDYMRGDGSCQSSCNTYECGYDHGDCESNQCSPGCFGTMVGDGSCQAACDVPDCWYDAGDCY